MNDVLYAASGDGYIYAIKAQSGVLLWKFGVLSPIYSSPVVNNGKVYFGANNGYFYSIK